MAQGPQRIVSINLCTDQYLLAFAPERILALTDYADDPRISYFADQARGHAQIGGSAEEVLDLEPDLVLAGRFTKLQTRRFLAAKGIAVEVLAPVRSLSEARAQIEQMGELLGARDKARALTDQIDQVLAGTGAANAAGLTALQLQRRAFAAGTDTLVGDLMTAFGLVNAAHDLDLQSTGQTSLEAVIKTRPDLLILDRINPHPSDQGEALLHHRVLAALYPPERRLTLPLASIICGGPSLVEAIEQFADELARAAPEARGRR